MLIEAFCTEPLGTNCLVVAAAPDHGCVIIDPGLDALSQIRDIVTDNRLTPVAVMATHGHFDHTLSVQAVADAYNIAAYIHSADRHHLSAPQTGIGLPVGEPLCGQTQFQEPQLVKEYCDGQVVELADLTWSIHATPGHTAGSVVLLVEDVDSNRALFTGDVLFAGAIGRVDLPTGDEQSMRRSLRSVLERYDDGLLVYPGHGPTTTIGHERVNNPYLHNLH